MDFLSTEEYERETMRRALEGDHESGIKALELCRSGLFAGKLSETMAFYLADRLGQILDGIKPDRALCIAKPANRPADPFPEWQQELGALAALLSQRGLKPGVIGKILSDARTAVHQRGLDKREANRIMNTWKPMRQLQADDLVRYVGPYGEILKQFTPRN